MKLEQIRKELSQAIKDCGLTQTQLAEKVQVSQQTISEYLHGRSLPALDTLSLLCTVLDLDANEILCVEHKKEY